MTDNLINETTRQNALPECGIFVPLYSPVKAFRFREYCIIPNWALLPELVYHKRDDGTDSFTGITLKTGTEVRTFSIGVWVTVDASNNSKIDVLSNEEFNKKYEFRSECEL